MINSSHALIELNNFVQEKLPGAVLQFQFGDTNLRTDLSEGGRHTSNIVSWDELSKSLGDRVEMTVQSMINRLYPGTTPPGAA